ncbi:hypothetical protein TrRE_jg1362 [Triparma retinervis]|uniref:WW domain-containing protein n=1 Tax=Triparma retinervis TaxID=2557542 RepID=A0A9W7E7V8_9STRA|nr:hypothetical protein TrRE_jg1362 [Triparma retinervis]
MLIMKLVTLGIKIKSSTPLNRGVTSYIVTFPGFGPSTTEYTLPGKLVRKCRNIPEGWTELKTADGQTYFLNDRNGETQWEVPEDASEETGVVGRIRGEVHKTRVRGGGGRGGGVATASAAESTAARVAKGPEGANTPKSWTPLTGPNMHPKSHQTLERAPNLTVAIRPQIPASPIRGRPATPAGADGSQAQSGDLPAIDAQTIGKKNRTSYSRRDRMSDKRSKGAGLTAKAVTIQRGIQIRSSKGLATSRQPRNMMNDEQVIAIMMDRGFKGFVGRGCGGGCAC